MPAATVTQLMTAAFAVATSRHAPLLESWVRISTSLGGLIPASMLIVSVQRLGHLDILLRALEEERGVPSSAATLADAYSLNQQFLLSEAWVGAAYEILRLLAERDLAPIAEEFRSLAHDLRLLRIPIEKHQIANDRALEAPLQLTRRPPRGDGSDVYEYVLGDKARAHIMPSALSERGSASWHVTELAKGAEPSARWLERLSLSERFLGITWR